MSNFPIENQTNDVRQSTQDRRRQKLEQRIGKLLRAMTGPEATAAGQSYPACGEAIAEFVDRVSVLRSRLESIPPIDVAVLGPSRHGKSTLLNALVQTSLLPTSDEKPCTASILRMTWDTSWSARIQFASREQLQDDLTNAIRDAEQALRIGDPENEAITREEPRFVKTILQRFIRLFRINPDLAGSELLKEVQNASIPSDIEQCLGKAARVSAENLTDMRKTLEKYLSTRDVYWTIIRECQIRGPFPDWHPSLSIVDVPGTNDTDPQRTLVTNSLRNSAKAVAIVTSDSNLGPDIEGWLRNSSVLANFLEATQKRRQRLFIIRTKLDSYHPETESSELETDAEDDFAAHWHAVSNYQERQTQTYRTMLRDIAGPKLPDSANLEAQSQRDELLGRIDKIPVFFVSALAHEVFSGRFAATRRTQRQLKDYFNEKLETTGIPGLRRFLTGVADQYLSENYYEDLESSLDREVSLLAASFRTIIAAETARAKGGLNQLNTFVEEVGEKLIPWVRRETTSRKAVFERQTRDAASVIRVRLNDIAAASERRFASKIDVWAGLHWASLRAVARKAGVHTTGRGQTIDFAEDICGVLLDDLILAWTHYRDHLIERATRELVADFTDHIARKLGGMVSADLLPSTARVVDELQGHLNAILEHLSLKLRDIVGGKVKEFESLRKPAYSIAQREMGIVFSAVLKETGTGSSQRMQQAVRSRSPAAIDRIRRQVIDLVQSVVGDLATECSAAIQCLGDEVVAKLTDALRFARSNHGNDDPHTIERRVRKITTAIALLPAPPRT